jgi:hypothetical protein
MAENWRFLPPTIGVCVFLALASQSSPATVAAGRLYPLMNACDAVQDNAPQIPPCRPAYLPDTDGVIVAVKDSGAGLSDDELARIFEPFCTARLTAWGWVCRSAAPSSPPMAASLMRRVIRTRA